MTTSVAGTVGTVATDVVVDGTVVVGTVADVTTMDDVGSVTVSSVVEVWGDDVLDRSVVTVDLLEAVDPSVSAPSVDGAGPSAPVDTAPSDSSAEVLLPWEAIANPIEPPSAAAITTRSVTATALARSSNTGKRYRAQRVRINGRGEFSEQLGQIECPEVREPVENVQVVRSLCGWLLRMPRQPDWLCFV